MEVNACNIGRLRETDMALLSGVYEIRNTSNGHRYIGSSVNISRRLSEHKRCLVLGNHHSVYLQRAWNKYGESNFAHSTLLYCDPDNLALYEQICINGLFPEYNVSKDVVAFTHGLKFPGRKLSEENRRNIGKSNSGKIRSEETRLKISNALKGNIISYETRRKISVANKGKPKPPRSEEHKRKLGLCHIGKHLSVEHRKKLSISKIGNTNVRGHHLSEEHKHKISLANKNKIVTIETRKKLSEAAKCQWIRQRRILNVEEPVKPDEGK